MCQQRNVSVLRLGDIEGKVFLCQMCRETRQMGFGCSFLRHALSLGVQLRSCPAANELLVQVCSQQRTVHKRALRVRCMPNSFTGKYQPNGSWDPVSSAISVRCENNPKVQIGSLLFELLNAKVWRSLFVRVLCNLAFIWWFMHEFFFVESLLGTWKSSGRVLWLCCISSDYEFANTQIAMAVVEAIAMTTTWLEDIR